MVDSRPETRKHIAEVANRMMDAAARIRRRAIYHDASKLNEPELPYFDEATPKLAKSAYDSPEYRQALKDMAPGLEHHYKNNSHHPEFYENGIAGMSLLDLIEMLCDWDAATKRHPNGNLLDSFQINAVRFDIEPQLLSVLVNTASELGFLDPQPSVA